MAEKRIFISYCRADAALANLLKAHLEEAQLPAWMDPDIRTGESWREAIDKAILEAKAVVVILSPRANASGYVNYEWAFALGAGLTVVPLLFGLSPQELHPRLAALQALGFGDPLSRPWGELLSRLKELTGSQAPAKTQAAPSVIENAARGLDSLDPAERLRAIETLKEMDTPAAAEMLAGALQHAVSQVRLEAAFALLKFQDARAIPVLLEGVAANGAEGRLNSSWEEIRRIGPPAVWRPPEKPQRGSSRQFHWPTAKRPATSPGQPSPGSRKSIESHFASRH